MLATLALLATSRLAAGQAPAVTCRVDPAVELMSTLAVLGGQHRLATDYEYRREVLTRFGAFANHPAVRGAAVFTASGHDDFVALLGARVGPPPALAERGRLYPVGEGPGAIGIDSLRKFLVAARAFAAASDFATFHAEHAAFYADLCARLTADSTLGRTASRIASYFQERAASYEVVPMPLVPRLGVAAHREGPVATARMTAFIGPATIDSGMPRFRTGWAMERVVLHEFAHQYVNVVLQTRRPQIDKSASLMAPVRARLWRADHVATWSGAMAETFVRAAVAEMRREDAGDEAARTERREHRALGFAMVDSVAAAFRAAPRGPAWLSRATRDVFAMLDRIAASPNAIAVADPPFDAGMALGLISAMPDSVAFILPTGEHDPLLQDTLYANVRRMSAQSAPRATILTDREALARDLRGWTLWAIGTMHGNAWLAAHTSAVPATIDSTRIVAGASHMGRTLVFASAVPSPIDPRHALLLTVGQRVDELARGWWLLAADYAVMDGTRALERGSYADITRAFLADGVMP